MTDAEGQCLCGAVRFSVSGPLRPVVYCHCEQCRRSSGHFVAATACHPADLKIADDAALRWYRSSAEAERGFCGNCGSSLFWRPDHRGHTSIMAGSLDRPTGLTAKQHIFVNMSSDYYEISDGLPRYDEDHPASFPGEGE
ncbi:MAG: GFA family protein [Gammaproteobacteria bacterium]|nr:GFA family protein [Gammaproteobacteria bacterium]